MSREDNVHNYATVPNGDDRYLGVDIGTLTGYSSPVTWSHGFNDELKDEIRKLIKDETDTSNKVLMIDKDGIPKWSEPPKKDNILKDCKKVNHVVEEHTVEVKPEKSKEDIKMKKFLKKAFVAVFVAIGIFSTVNYFTGNRVVPFVKDKLEVFVDWTGDMWIIISSNGKYHGRHWDEYTTEYKKKVFRALPLAEQKELMDFLKSGVKEEIKAFEENIK